MGQVCLICTHPNRDAMERAIVKGTSLRQLAKDYGVGYDSLYNHSKEHIPKSLVEAFSRVELSTKYDLLMEIEDILHKAKDIFDRNYEAKKDAIALKSLGETRNTIDLLARIIHQYHQTKLLELEIAEKQEKVAGRGNNTAYEKALQALTFDELIQWDALLTKVSVYMQQPEP